MIRHTVRSLLRTPGFTLVALFCLALGIGATTCIFSIVNAVLFRPLPFKNPESLVRVYTEFTRFPGGGLHKFWVSEPEVFKLKEAHSFSALGAWQTGGVNLSKGGEPVRATAGFVSADLLRGLGVPPLLGRLPTYEEDKPGAPATAVLSYGEWRSYFAGDSSVLGRRVYVDSQPATVIGIMPQSFAFPPADVDPPQLWTPLQLNPLSTTFSNHSYNVAARLAPGVTIDRARGELHGLVQEWGKAESDKNHVLSAKDHPVSIYGFHSELVGSVRRSMFVLLGAVVFVLMIACVNVANLLLARSEGRQREIAVRRAIGASRAQLLRQFLLEGLILSGLGTLLGVALATGGMRVVELLNAGSLPVSGAIDIDWRVLVFTVAMSFVCGVVFGFAPMFQVSALRIYETLKANSGRSSSTTASNRFRSGLVIAQMAMSFLLVAGAGLMVNGFVKLQNVNAGFNAHGILTAQLSLPSVQYPGREQQAAFIVRLQRELDRMPGVVSATVTEGLPPVRPVNDNTTDIEGFMPSPNGPTNNIAYYQIAGDHFVQTLGAHLEEGRDLTPYDGDPTHPGILVNRTMARTFWPHTTTALGHRIRPFFPGAPWFSIVGVVSDIKNGGLDQPTGTEAFFPARIGGGSTMYLLVRTTGDPAAAAGTLRRVVQSVDPALPLSKVQTMDDVLASSNARPRFMTLVITLFSGLALGLAAVGIYGLISYSVAQRTAELGIRMALGATPGGLWWQVLRHGLIMAAAGWAIGAAGALFLSRTLTGLVFGIEAQSWASWTLAVVIMAAATVTACSVPALRASKTNPIQALRYD